MNENNSENDKMKEMLRNKIISYHDFPKKGVIFRDIFSLLQEPPSFKSLMLLLEEEIKPYCSEFDVIIGLDSRGFIFASPLALTFMKPFVPIRKKGKLPGIVQSLEFSLEYGKDICEIQKSALKPGQKVLIIDDLLATGGTLKAAADLVTSLGVEVTCCVVCIELTDLKGREKINHPIISLLNF